MKYLKSRYEESFTDSYQKTFSLINAPFIALSGLMMIYSGVNFTYLGYIKLQKGIPLEDEFEFFIPIFFAGVFFLIFAVKVLFARRFTSAAYVFAAIGMVFISIALFFTGNALIYGLLGVLLFLVAAHQQRKRGY